MKLCKHDLPHLGALLQHTRQSRGIPAKTVATMCKKNKSTISKLENGQTIGRDTVKQYVDVLKSDSVSPPINRRQGGMLIELFDHDREKNELESDLAVVNFEVIKSRHQPSELKGLVTQLELEERPAFIMDDLWFIHALNGSALKLFDLNPRSDILYRWEGWHVIASKFVANSNVRNAHPNTNEYFPPTIVAFFEDKRTYPFLFTIQMRKLICKLIELSEQNKFEFHKWWSQTTAFNLPFKPTSLTRTIIYQGQPIQLEAAFRFIQEVELFKEYPVQYTLAVWDPIGSDARNAFEDIRNSSWSNEVFFATDYDKNRNFHINTWPEVKSEIENRM